MVLRRRSRRTFCVFECDTTHVFFFISSTHSLTFDTNTHTHERTHTRTNTHTHTHTNTHTHTQHRYDAFASDSDYHDLSESQIDLSESQIELIFGKDSGDEDGFEEEEEEKYVLCVRV